MHLLAKAGIAAATIAISGVSGWTIYTSTLPSTIGQSLEASGGHKLITLNYENIDKLIEKYEGTEDPKKPERISDLNLSSSSDKKQDLINKCKKLWETSIKDTQKDKIESNIKNWCVENPAALNNQ